MEINKGKAEGNREWVCDNQEKWSQNKKHKYHLDSIIKKRNNEK